MGAVSYINNKNINQDVDEYINNKKLISENEKRIAEAEQKAGIWGSDGIAGRGSMTEEAEEKREDIIKKRILQPMNLRR